MLKFILFVFVSFLVIRMVLRVLRIGVRFFTTGSARRSGSSTPSFSSGNNIEEADYEVIESNLNDNERNERK
jgi:hypothetical protein